MGRRIALATAAEVADLDPDDRLLVTALDPLGMLAEPAVWDDPTVDWAAFDLVVVRSTWDYPGRRERFVAWARRVAAATRLANPAEVLAWNTDKRYLAELAGAGVPVVETMFIAPGEEVVLPVVGEYVVKPTVSAGSRDTARYAAADAPHARRHAEALLSAGRTVMVQPYQASVDAHGETALLHLGGAYSHAVVKGPLLQRGGAMPTGLYAAEDIGATTATPAQRELAAQALAALPLAAADLLYARVDLVEDDSGAPRLLELELTEPSLFLAHAPGAADRLARAILRLLDGRG